MFVDLGLRNLQLCKTPLMVITMMVYSRSQLSEYIGTGGTESFVPISEVSSGVLFKERFFHACLLTNGHTFVQRVCLYCSCVDIIILLLWGKFSSSNNFNIETRAFCSYLHINKTDPSLVHKYTQHLMQVMAIYSDR